MPFLLSGIMLSVVYAECRSAQQIVTKIITLAISNLVTPKAGAKHELLFN
jgi:hypothetical protein